MHGVPVDLWGEVAYLVQGDFVGDAADHCERRALVHCAHVLKCDRMSHASGGHHHIRARECLVNVLCGEAVEHRFE